MVRQQRKSTFRVFSRCIRVHTRASVLISLIRQSAAGGGQRARRLAARDALTDERVFFRDSVICRHTRSVHALYGKTTLSVKLTVTKLHITVLHIPGVTRRNVLTIIDTM